MSNKERRVHTCVEGGGGGWVRKLMLRVMNPGDISKEHREGQELNLENNYFKKQEE